MQSKLLAKSQTWLLANMESILHWNIFVTTSFELCAQLAIVFTEQNIELNFVFLKLNIEHCFVLLMMLYFTNQTLYSSC